MIFTSCGELAEICTLSIDFQHSLLKEAAHQNWGGVGEWGCSTWVSTHIRDGYKDFEIPMFLHSYCIH